MASAFPGRVTLLLFFTVLAGTATACNFQPAVDVAIATENDRCSFNLYPSSRYDDIGPGYTPPFTYSNFSKCQKLRFGQERHRLVVDVLNEIDSRNLTYMYDSVRIRHQTATEYRFLRLRSRIANNDPCRCLQYENVTRYEEVNWTLVVKDSRCGNDQTCQLVPRRGCMFAGGSPRTIATLQAIDFVALAVFNPVEAAILSGLILLAGAGVYRSRRSRD